MEREHYEQQLEFKERRTTQRFCGKCYKECERPVHKTFKAVLHAGDTDVDADWLCDGCMAKWRYNTNDAAVEFWEELPEENRRLEQELSAKNSDSGYFRRKKWHK